MARRSRGFAVVQSGTKRLSDWGFLTPGISTIAAASTATLVASLNAAALAIRPFTIVRTRGLLFSRSDQSAATENYGGAFGMAVVSDQASLIGVSAIPTPITDMGSDLWFVHEQAYGRMNFKDASGVFEEGHTHRFDSKAMRKVNADQDIVFVVETPSFSSSWSVMSTLRFLVKLH